MKKTFLILLFAIHFLPFVIAKGRYDTFLKKVDTYPFIIVDKQTFKLSVVDSTGELIKTYPIACGVNYGDKVAEGDLRTPEGIFKISQIMKSSYLTHDFGDGKGEVPGAYGPWFLRLNVPNFKGIAIHGTHLPESIGSRATEGCIRLKNEDIEELRTLVHIGMPVIILPDSIPEASVSDSLLLSESSSHSCNRQEAILNRSHGRSPSRLLLISIPAVLLCFVSAIIILRRKSDKTDNESDR